MRTSHGTTDVHATEPCGSGESSSVHPTEDSVGCTSDTQISLLGCTKFVFGMQWLQKKNGVRKPQQSHSQLSSSRSPFTLLQAAPTPQPTVHISQMEKMVAIRRAVDGDSDEETDTATDW